MFLVRGSLAPSKVEKLVVLKENRKLIKEFKMRGNYEMKKGGEVNAFLTSSKQSRKRELVAKELTSTSRIWTCSLMISKRMSR